MGGSLASRRGRRRCSQKPATIVTIGEPVGRAPRSRLGRWVGFSARWIGYPDEHRQAAANRTGQERQRPMRPVSPSATCIERQEVRVAMAKAYQRAARQRTGIVDHAADREGPAPPRSRPVTTTPPPNGTIRPEPLSLQRSVGGDRRTAGGATGVPVRRHGASARRSKRGVPRCRLRTMRFTAMDSFLTANLFDPARFEAHRLAVTSADGRTDS